MSTTASGSTYPKYSGRILPLVVLGGMAALGVAGHWLGWKIPRPSQWFSRPTVEETWCDEHSVPEEICVACNADLFPKPPLTGWCREHGVAECVLHDPRMGHAMNRSTWSEADLERAAAALRLRPRQANNPSCKLHLRRIQFVDEAAVEKAGVDIRFARRGAVVETIAASGEITYDPTLVSRLRPRAAGTVWRVEKNVGDPVREGDVLAIIDSAEVGRAKTELVTAAAELELARQTLSRLAGLDDVVERRRLETYEADQAKARSTLRRSVQTLVNLGLPLEYDEVEGRTPEELTEELEFLGLPPDLRPDPHQRASGGNLVPLSASRDGVVTHRDAVAGEVVDTTRTLFTVVDTRRMWLVLNVPLEDVRYVRAGQTAIFRPDGEERDRSGTITWVSTGMDPQTRMVQVRAELANDDGRLFDETFGMGEIVLRETPDAVVVPSQAVQWEGCCHVVFVRDRSYADEGSYKVFHARMVRPGVARGGLTEMIAGVLPGELVVTEGSDILRAELLKGNLGAG